MIKKIALALALVLVAFLGHVSTRPGQFRYERTGLINAPAEKIYPYLSDFKLGHQWQPFDNTDPNMKRTYSGPSAGTGSKLEFAGNSEAGTGYLEILNTIPNQLVEMKLVMTAPLAAENLVTYTLTPEGNATRFAWSMAGDGGFVGKLINVSINREKMMTEQFDKGIANLKAIVEAP